MFLGWVIYVDNMDKKGHFSFLNWWLPLSDGWRVTYMITQKFSKSGLQDPTEGSSVFFWIDKVKTIFIMTRRHYLPFALC